MRSASFGRKARKRSIAWSFIAVLLKDRVAGWVCRARTQLAGSWECRVLGGEVEQWLAQARTGAGQAQRNGASGASERGSGLALAETVPGDQQQDLPLGFAQAGERGERTLALCQRLGMVWDGLGDRRRDPAHKSVLAPLAATQIRQDLARYTEQPGHGLARHVGNSPPRHLESPRECIGRQVAIRARQQIRRDAIEMLPVNTLETLAIKSHLLISHPHLSGRRQGGSGQNAQRCYARVFKLSAGVSVVVRSSLELRWIALTPSCLRS